MTKKFRANVTFEKFYLLFANTRSQPWTFQQPQKYFIKNGKIGDFTLTETETDTETEKNYLYIFVWRCLYCTETPMPLGTVAIVLVSVSVSVNAP